MCFAFPRRRGKRPTLLPVSDDHHIGLSAMHRMVGTTTLASPTYKGHHLERLSVPANNNGNVSISKRPASPIFSLGENIQSQLEYIFRTLCSRSPTTISTTLSHTFHNRRLSLPGVPRPYLTREKLAVFLEQTQGEVLTVALDKDRYHFEDFLQIWQHMYSCNASRPPALDEIMNMSLPISHYFISSSHNTYLSGNQLSSPAEVSEYQKVLQGNCRCIEIDVWNPQRKTKPKKNSNVQSQKPNHRRHISATSVAASLHGSLEAIASLFASRVPHSRASSFSQRSFHSSAHGEDAPATKQFDQAAMLSRLREENSQLVADEAIDDADDYIEDAQAAPLTTSDSETPNTSQTSQMSQETAVPAIAQISVTAPDTNVSFPAQVHDETEWWGGNEPIVMHAHTFGSKDVSLGTKVQFRDVCRAIKHSAFTTNHMPIIVSLEVHTNAEQQHKMVKIMREEWGDQLLEAPLDGTDPRLRLPTLGELQNKILVKVKRPYTPSWSAGGASSAALLQGFSLGASLSAAQHVEQANSSDSEDEAPLSNVNSPAIRNAKITEELGNLAVYTESRRLTRFTDRDAKLPSHIFSLSETKIQELHEKSHEELFDHNKKYLMRAYPNATKHVMSTNPDPACCWRRGVQMVALNWQSLDKAMMLNHGMFEGTHGWVLKPEGYRFSTASTGANSAVGDSSASYSTSETAGPTAFQMTASTKPGTGICPVAVAEPTCSLDLYITVYAGQHLPLSPVLENKIKKKYAGKARSIASTAGFVTNRGHAHFRPFVKCELNVEHAEKRCPETVASSSRSLGGKTGTTSSSTSKIPNSVFFASSVRTSTPAIAGVGAPSLRVAISPTKPGETLNKHKTSASKTDHPHWGPGGETLSFPNINHIVESLSFITFLVEDEGSKDALGLSDTLAGWACIRLDRLRTGYRFVQLMDCHGRPTEGKLLVKIEKRYRS